MKKGNGIAMLLAGLLMLPQLSMAEPEAGTTKTEPKTGMQFVWVPSGCFNMGGSGHDEKPAHKVCFKKGFWIGKYEVTKAQYKHLLTQAQYKSLRSYHPSYFNFTDSNDSNDSNLPAMPANYVSWKDASDAGKNLSDIAGGRYRLPSEAEWEYACKAGRNSKYCGASDEPDDVALHWGTHDYDIHMFAYPVGSKRANGWGLYDMSGNVWEWVQDCWNDSYNGAPTDGSAWKTGQCHDRVLRGGAWESGEISVRSANRLWDSSTLSLDYFGFRLVQD